jgi:hypothetical protein
LFARHTTLDLGTLPSMHDAGENPNAQLQAEFDRSRENLLRFIRLEFAMAETLWSLLKQTEKKRQRKRLRDDIRKAKVSIVHFKKKLDSSDAHGEVDGYIEKIDSHLRDSSSPSVVGMLLKRLRRRTRKLRSGRGRSASDRDR